MLSERAAQLQRETDTSFRSTLASTTYLSRNILDTAVMGQLPYQGLLLSYD